MYMREWQVFLPFFIKRNISSWPRWQPKYGFDFEMFKKYYFQGTVKQWQETILNYTPKLEHESEKYKGKCKTNNKVIILRNKNNNVHHHSSNYNFNIFHKLCCLPDLLVCSELPTFPWLSTKGHWTRIGFVPDFVGPENKIHYTKQIYWSQNWPNWFDFDYMMPKWHNVKTMSAF